MDNNKNQEPAQPMSMVSRLHDFFGSSPKIHHTENFKENKNQLRWQLTKGALGFSAYSALFGFKVGEKAAYNTTLREFQSSAPKMPFRYPYRAVATVGGTCAYMAFALPMMIFSVLDEFILKPKKKKAPGVKIPIYPQKNQLHYAHDMQKKESNKLKP